MQSLKTIRKQASGGAPQVLDRMIERVEAGEPLYKAAVDYDPPFDDLVIGMLRAAEASGRTPRSCTSSPNSLTAASNTPRGHGCSVLPFLVALLIIASVVILVTVVIPRIMEPIIAAGGE